MLTIADGRERGNGHVQTSIRQYVTVSFILFVPMIVTVDAAASVDDLSTILSINVRGVMLCYKYAALQMVKQGRGGRIIGEYDTICDACHTRFRYVAIIRSILGSGEEGWVAISFLLCMLITLPPGVPNMAAYSASKFAVRGLTQACGRYSHGGHHISLNFCKHKRLSGGSTR